MSGALFISTADAAALIGIPQSTLKFWEWSDTVPEGFPKSVKVGRLRMYEAAAVRAWAEQQIAVAVSGGGEGA